MDSLTQIVLGAGISEALLGRKLGWRAALWGAFAGTLPDLDVFSALFLDPVDYLATHRGFSHSVFFPFLAAPILAVAARRAHRDLEPEFRPWALMFFWVLLTHPLLDSLTGYGTQLFNPFSDYAFEFNTIFIIDPLYTLPFLSFLLIGISFKPGSLIRKRLVLTGLMVSTMYLTATIGMKWMAHERFEAEIARQGIPVERSMTVPGPFTSIYWRILIENADGFTQGYLSLLDPDPEVVFRSVPKNHSLAEPWADTEAMRRLVWFSKGFYTVSLRDGVPYINDLRFGSLFGWRGDMEEHVFSFRLDTDREPVSFTQIREPVDVTADDLRALFKVMFKP
jgi:inner membrane protein